MAKLVLNQSENPINAWKVATLGAACGLLFWCCSNFLQKWFALSIAGNVATLIILTVSLFALVFIHANRPILVVVSSAVALWGLAATMRCLNFPINLILCTSIYVLSYSFFGWIAYIRRSSVAIIIALLAIVVIRFISSNIMV